MAMMVQGKKGPANWQSTIQNQRYKLETSILFFNPNLPHGKTLYVICYYWFTSSYAYSYNKQRSIHVLFHFLLSFVRQQICRKWTNNWKKRLYLIYISPGSIVSSGRSQKATPWKEKKTVLNH